MSRIFTIGHSNIDFDLFGETLLAYNIQKLIDVRSFPGSRYVPHFNKENISETLKEKNIEYQHFPILGGRRKSYNPNDYDFVKGWKHTSFKNYASYTMTEEYTRGINELIDICKENIICIMCAEAVPWRCHRLLISNTLVTKNIEVIHIINKNKWEIHQLNKYGAFAEINENYLIYP